jgi:hypothetical protein
VPADYPFAAIAVFRQTLDTGMLVEPGSRPAPGPPLAPRLLVGTEGTNR